MLDSKISRMKSVRILVLLVFSIFTPEIPFDIEQMSKMSFF